MLTLIVWMLLATGAALGPIVGQAPSLLTASCAALALLLWRRPERSAEQRGEFASTGLASAAGFIAYPSWIAITLALGAISGLQWIEPVPAGTLALAALPFVVIQLVLAPVLEELLFRERIVTALRASVGGPGAVVGSSLLFAAAHGEPWRALGALSVGLLLGLVYHRTGSLRWCVGYHVGLNAAALLCGSPPTRWALPAAISLVCGAGVAWISLRVLASGAARRADPDRVEWVERVERVGRADPAERMAIRLDNHPGGQRG